MFKLGFVKRNIILRELQGYNNNKQANKFKWAS